MEEVIFQNKLEIQSMVKCERFLDKLDILHVPKDKINECLKFLLDIYKPYKPKKREKSDEIVIPSKNDIR